MSVKGEGKCLHGEAVWTDTRCRYSKLKKFATMHVTIRETDDDHEPHTMAPPSIQMPIYQVTGNQDKQNIDDYIKDNLSIIEMDTYPK